MGVAKAVKVTGHLWQGLYSSIINGCCSVELPLLRRLLRRCYTHAKLNGGFQQAGGEVPIGTWYAQTSFKMYVPSSCHTRLSTGNWLEMNIPVDKGK
jgi:hypothetical protein